MQSFLLTNLNCIALFTLKIIYKTIYSFILKIDVIKKRAYCKYMRIIAIILVICLWTSLFINFGMINVFLNIATTFVVLKLLNDRKK
ncbi:hypothetical protein BUZ27_08855 [Staphylococcus haemolyticus]|nr:hypothetical protein BUZ38_07225 [Staphylococcus haemolyticus]PTK49060.1 hypothetical protein BUZ43_04480 [Staphylococcus haemolyticus]PTK53711.1 hypothetical protein BUZ37_07060 [Staphylococcus haemolyticus]PTK61765.1 hypothetical protein BUZ36_06135 [Staphylococcus haemolyticus]PTK64565.1 hypothetical protein BUZ40_02765 [Staphylococcus haemolyticus]